MLLGEIVIWFCLRKYHTQSNCLFSIYIYIYKVTPNTLLQTFYSGWDTHLIAVRLCICFCSIIRLFNRYNGKHCYQIIVRPNTFCRITMDHYFNKHGHQIIVQISKGTIYSSLGTCNQVIVQLTAWLLW